MECAIEVDADYGPECFMEKNPTARKYHVCCECHGDIEPGERYRVETGIWDGEPRSYKTCIDCLSVRDALFCGWEYGRLWELVDEHIQDMSGEIMTSAFAKLTPAARESISDMIEDHWAEYYFNFPTQPAVRLEAKVGRERTGSIPWGVAEWIRERYREMEAIDAALPY